MKRSAFASAEARASMRFGNALRLGSTEAGPVASRLGAPQVRFFKLREEENRTNASEFSRTSHDIEKIAEPDKLS